MLFLITVSQKCTSHKAKRIKKAKKYSCFKENGIKYYKSILSYFLFRNAEFMERLKIPLTQLIIVNEKKSKKLITLIA